MSSLSIVYGCSFLYIYTLLIFRVNRYIVPEKKVRQPPPVADPSGKGFGIAGDGCLP